MTSSATRSGLSTHEADPSLIARCLDGDAAAWTSLGAHYNRLVFAWPTAG